MSVSRSRTATGSRRTWPRGSRPPTGSSLSSDEEDPGPGGSVDRPARLLPRRGPRRDQRRRAQRQTPRLAHGTRTPLDSDRRAPGPGATIGLMTLATVRSSWRLRPADVELAQQLARRAAVAVDNSRLHTKLSGVAETLQRALLPATLPAVEHWEIASLYRPTETDLRIDVGGDFYEVFDREGTWFVILGDVTGKGVTAATVTALLRHGDPRGVADGTVAGRDPRPARRIACDAPGRSNGDGDLHVPPRTTV